MTGFRLAPLYPITSSETSPARDHLWWARTFLQAGIRFFQVRDKRMPDRDLLRTLCKIRELCRSRDAQFVVNDRVDLALASGADGVHLGQTDLPASAARRILGDNAIIGISTHDMEQFEQALRLEVDYIACGPVFESSTKPGHAPVLGCSFLEKASSLPRAVPLVAIGGIDLQRAAEAWRSGADSVAVISDIVLAEDPIDRIRAYLQGREG